MRRSSSAGSGWRHFDLKRNGIRLDLLGDRLRKLLLAGELRRADHGQGAGDDEITFCCGNERSIGGMPHDLERPLDSVGPRGYGQFLPHPLGGAGAVGARSPWPRAALVLSLP